MKQKNFTNEEVASLCKALAYLLQSGIPVADSLHMLSQEEKAPSLAQALTRMAEKTDAGAPLWETVQAESGFPAYAALLIKVGQQVGKTPETLLALGWYYDRRDRMHKQLRNAVAYPMALLGVLLGVIIVLLVWVMPVFHQAYAQLGGTFTGLAGTLLALGQWIKNALPVLAGLLLVMAAILGIAPSRQKLIAFGKKLFHNHGTMKAVQSARLLQVLSMGLQSGMTDFEAVTLAGELAQTGGKAFAENYRACLTCLEQGKTLPEALAEGEFLMSRDSRLLEAARRSGRTAEVMEDIAARVTVQSEEALEKMLGRIEPAMVLIACGLIGCVLLAVMLPLLNIMSTIG